jgi:TolB-like protein/DNA-binding winged helix-turn-helix (wHTH) protein/Tfp pilus assembly protein PilF
MLHDQPLHILRMLLDRPGEVVTREEIQKELWPSDTFVDFEDSLNHAIRRLREALDDSADHPRFVETLPRRGYRFIAPVEAVAPVGARPDLIGDPRPEGAARRAALQKRFALAGGLLVATAALLALNVAGLRDRVLRAVGAVREPPLQIHSIAVLPLENLSGDEEQEYFADGMTDALITDLGQISALRVISRQSMMHYKGTNKRLPEIAKELNVDAIVEGTVQRSGERIRITAQLLDARSDRHLWASAYERDLRDVLALQSEVAQAVARAVHVQLSPLEQIRVARARAVDPQAFELYLKGRDWQRRHDRKRSLECFQRAVERDPTFARGYIGLASAYASLGHAGELPAVDAFAKVKAFGHRALELDDSLTEARLAIADGLQHGEWDWLGAERELRQALEVNPNSASARGVYSHHLSLLGRPREAIAEAKRALEIDPLSAWRYHGLGTAYFFDRQYDLTLEQCQKTLQLSPEFKDAHELIAWACVEKGMFKEAIAEFSKDDPDFRNIPPIMGHLGNAYARAGQRAAAHRILQELIEQTKEKRGAYEVALVYTGLSEKDRAFEWLENAYNMHDKGMCYLKVDPSLDPLRSDPRFQDLLRRMNFPE